MTWRSFPLQSVTPVGEGQWPKSTQKQKKLDIELGL